MFDPASDPYERGGINFAYVIGASHDCHFFSLILTYSTVDMGETSTETEASRLRAEFAKYPQNFSLYWWFSAANASVEFGVQKTYVRDYKDDHEIDGHFHIGSFRHSRLSCQLRA
jgi:hypothetical protein